MAHSKKPQPKVVAGVVSGAAVVAALAVVGVSISPEIGALIATVLSFVFSYMTPQ